MKLLKTFGFFFALAFIAGHLVREFSGGPLLLYSFLLAAFLTFFLVPFDKDK